MLLLMLCEDLSHVLYQKNRNMCRKSPASVSSAGSECRCASALLYGAWGADRAQGLSLQ